METMKNDKQKEKMSLENLNREIDSYKAKKHARTMQEQRERKKEQEENRDFESKEKKLLGKKLQIYNEIAAWRNKFVKANASLMSLLDEDEIIIYYGNWGHERPAYSSYGCWSRVYLEKSGKLRYWAGYKWMPSGPEFNLNQQIVSRLSYDYLNKLHRHVITGQVYKTIKQEIKEREDLF